MATGKLINITAIEKTLIMLVKHIRPDGEFMAFTCEEREILEQLVKLLEEDLSR